MTEPQKSIAVCPGSYDPITNGHLDVIRRTAGLYDEVVVAVVNRSVRKSGALFSIDERMRFIEHATAGLDRGQGARDVRGEDRRPRARRSGQAAARRAEALTIRVGGLRHGWMS